MKFRSFSVLSGIAVLTLLATACGGGGDDSASSEQSTDGAMVIWADPNRTDVLIPYAERFGEAHGITMKVESIPNEDLQDNFVTAHQAGSPPDLVVGGLPEDPRAFNTVCVCPPVGGLLPGYDRIVLAGAPGRWLTEDMAKKTFRLPEIPAWTALLPDLAAMREVYLALMRVGRRPAWCPTLWQLIHMTAEEAGTAEIAAAASILAMADMGLFSIERSSQAFSITRSNRAKASPEQSAVWQMVQRWREGNLD